MVGFDMDITDRKHSEELLRFHSNILTNLAEGVMLTRAIDGVIVFTNQQFDRMFGYEQGELTGKHVSILNAPTNQSPELTANKILDALNRTGVWEGNVFNIKKDGTTFWCHANVSGFNHPELGRVWISCQNDISPRKLLEVELDHYRNQLEQRVQERTRELKEAQTSLEYAQSFANIMTTHVGLDGRWLKVPKTLCDLVGYSEEELLSKSFEHITHPDDFLADWNQCLKLILGEINSFELEKRYIHKNGKIIWVYLNCSVVLDKYEKPDYFLSYIIDITHKKELELQLKLSEERLERVTHGSNDIFWEWNIKNDKLWWSPKFYELLGYKEGEIIGSYSTFHSLMHPDDVEPVYRQIDQTLKDDTPLNIEYRLKTVLGSYRWFYGKAKVTRDKTGSPLLFSGSSHDITERKMSEETQTRLVEILENSSDFVGYANAKDTRILYINKSGRNMTGLGMNEDVTKLKIVDVHPESTNRLFRDEILRVATRDGIWQGECEFLHRDGHTIPTLMILIAHKSKNGEVEVYSTISRDITELKQNEEKLKSSLIAQETLLKEKIRAEKRFRSYFELPLIGIAITSPSKGWLEVNERLCQIFGYEREALLKMTWTEITHPDDLEKDVAMFNRVMNGEIDSYSIDKRFIRKNGEMIYASISARCIRLANGDVDYFVALVQDITESKNTEQAKLLIEERLRRVIDGSNDIYWEWDVKVDRVWWSPKFYEILGYKEEDFVTTYSSFPSLMHPDDVEPVYRMINNHLANNTPFEAQYRLKTSSGDYKWFLAKGKVTRDDNYHPVLFSGSAQEITERKSMIAKLEKSESNLRAIIEISPIPLALNDKQLNIIYLNPAFIKLFGYTLKDIPTVHDWWPKAYPDPKYRQWVIDRWAETLRQERQKGGSPTPIEYNVCCADGTVKKVAITTRSLDESIGLQIVMLYDITELKQNEEKLKSSIAEKELLLKEIGHRTKNNMEIISSLINIQLNTSKDAKFKAMARDLCNRILAMSSVYNKIFQSKKSNQDIELQDYLHDLIQSIMSSYGKDNKNIKLCIDANDILLDMGTSIYCGLIVNELVSNCFKHAFASIQNGLIDVIFQRKNGNIIIIVRDNGVGIPEEVDIYNIESMGMPLVLSLVEKQMRGKIEINRNSGTEIKAVFPEKGNILT